MKDKHKGLKVTASGVQDFYLCLLLFADDIVLLAETAAELQAMLNLSYQIAQQKRFKVQTEKSKVVVFGGSAADKSVIFTLGQQQLERVASYKYLGVKFHENLSFTEMKAELITKTNGRYGMINGAVVTGKIPASGSGHVGRVRPARPGVEHRGLG